MTMGDLADMGYLLAGAGYVSYAAFVMVTLWRLREWAGAAPQGGASSGRPTVRRMALTALDVLFLRRLLRLNPGLWLGEWLFHASLSLVFVRHLRFVFGSYQGWMALLNPVGVFAGYALAGALAYVIVYRALFMRGCYRPWRNVWLSAVVLGAAAIGLYMRLAGEGEPLLAKGFVQGLLTFAYYGPPEGAAFASHFLLGCAALVMTPSHALAAPGALYMAECRSEALEGLVHER